MDRAKGTGNQQVVVIKDIHDPAFRKHINLPVLPASTGYAMKALNIAYNVLKLDKKPLPYRIGLARVDQNARIQVSVTYNNEATSVLVSFPKHWLRRSYLQLGMIKRF
jgi:hypothetical protein